MIELYLRYASPYPLHELRERVPNAGSGAYCDQQDNLLSTPVPGQPLVLYLRVNTLHVHVHNVYASNYACTLQGTCACRVVQSKQGLTVCTVSKAEPLGVLFGVTSVCVSLNVCTAVSIFIFFRCMLSAFLNLSFFILYKREPLPDWIQGRWTITIFGALYYS